MLRVHAAFGIAVVLSFASARAEDVTSPPALPVPKGELSALRAALDHGARLLLRFTAHRDQHDHESSAPVDPAADASVLAPENRAVALTRLSLAPTTALTVSGAPLSCWDSRGISRELSRGNPGIDPIALSYAVEQTQITMGCRLRPQRTRCSWTGGTWNCQGG